MAHIVLSQVVRATGEVHDTLIESSYYNALEAVATAGLMRDLMGATEEFFFSVNISDGDYFRAATVDCGEDLHTLARLLADDGKIVL